MVEPVKWYRYLNQSSCVAIDGVDDVKLFDDMRRAMAVLDMPIEMQVHIQILSDGPMWDAASVWHPIVAHW